MFGYTFNELRGSEEWEVMKKYVYDHLADGSFKPEIARTFPFDQSNRGVQVPGKQRADREDRDHPVSKHLRPGPLTQFKLI